MNKKQALLLPLFIALASCGSFSNSINNPSNESLESLESKDSVVSTTSNTTSNTSSKKESTTSESVLSITPVSNTSSVSSTSVEPVNDEEASKITDLTANGISYSDNKFLITAAGEYSFKGTFEGNIEVNAPDQEVVIELAGFTISSSTNSPIYCKDADELKVKAKKDTTNYVYDNREAKPEDEEDEDPEQGSGAIYSKCDTKISGKGTLIVTANYNNGIHSTKDLKINHTPNNDSKVQVMALNNAIKGNDSLTINSGNIIAISTGGDGLETSDSDVSSKGNQRGIVGIYGGTINVYSCCDGINAAYDVVIANGTDDDGNVTTPNLSIITNKYSEYSGEVVVKSEKTMYLRTTTNSNTIRYALLFNDGEGNETWANATYKTSQRSGRNTYYFYEITTPSKASYFNVYAFSSSSIENDVTKATASTNKSVNINESFDTLTISTSNGVITAGNWTTFTTQSQGQGGFPGGGWGNEGNDDKAEYSAKGIKADNAISISAGNIKIKAYDDGIHAKYGKTLGDDDNPTTGVGDVTIAGGNLDIYASDDGIHADRYLTITGGDINVTNAYEGLEGTVISIEGGYTTVYATDDGLNVAKKAGNLNAQIKVSGGVVDTTVYGGDVDAIDSNGSFSQTGGIIISKGGTGNMSTGLDVDGTATISGGTFICFGKPEKTPSASGVTNKNFSGSYAIGTYRITNGNIDLTTSTKYSYSIIYVWTDDNVNFTFTKQ